MKKQEMFVLTLLLCFCILFAGCSSNSMGEEKLPNSESGQTNTKPIVSLKLAHMIAENSPEGIAAQAFADMVAEKSNGEIEIIIYPAEQLGDSKTTLESILVGSIDITMQAAQLMASYDDTFSLGSIPYLFKNTEIYTKIIREDLAEQQNTNLEKVGYQIVNNDRNFFRGPRCLVSAVPIRTADDLKGLRFRAYDNEVYITSYTKMGTVPLVISWGETYAALLQGTVKAAGSSFDQVYGTKFCEVCPYITWTHEYNTEVLYIANKNKWDSLSEHHRKILTECANESGNIMAAEVEKAIERDAELLIDEYNVEIIELDTAPIRELLTDYYYELEERGVIPKGIVETVLAE